MGHFLFSVCPEYPESREHIRSMAALSDSSFPAKRNWLFFCGGSGLKSLLPALFQRTSSGDCRSLRRLSLAVAVSDDGGSSRALMDSFGGLPVGDCRNIALTTADALLNVVSRTKRLDEEIIRSRKEVVRFLAHRLDASDEGAARKELSECVMSQCNDRLSSLHAASWGRISAGLSTFLECCTTLAKSPEGCEGLPAHLDSSFVLRNASVGNLVLFGLLMHHIRHRGQSPLSAAVTELSDDICGVQEMVRLCGVESLHVLPTLDYAYSTNITTEGTFPLVDVLPLPLVELCGVRRSGRVVRGQRSISYGSRLGSADLSDVYVTEKQHTTAVGDVPSPCDSSAPEFSHLAIPTDDKETVVVGAFRMLLLHKVSAPTDPCSSSSGAVLIRRSPMVQQQLIDRDTVLSDVMFARGSLYSSTLAAALPHLSALNAWKMHQSSHADGMATRTLHVMLNGSRDRETVAIGSAEEYVLAIEGLIGRVLLQDPRSAVVLDDITAEDIPGASGRCSSAHFEGFDALWATDSLSCAFALPAADVADDGGVLIGGRRREVVCLPVLQPSATHDDSGVAELLCNY